MSVRTVTTFVARRLPTIMAFETFAHTLFGNIGDGSRQTITLPDGTIATVEGNTEALRRTVEFTTPNGETIHLVLTSDPYSQQLTLQSETMNGIEMAPALLQDIATGLKSEGKTVVLSESTKNGSSSGSSATTGGSSSAAGAPDPDDNDPFKRPNDNLQKGDRVNLNQFEQRVKVDGEVRYQDPKSGYQIVKDRAGSNSHGGSAWKLLDRTGKRIGTLNADGTFLRK